jgi:hypothetical protein
MCGQISHLFHGEHLHGCVRHGCVAPELLKSPLSVHENGGRFVVPIRVMMGVKHLHPQHMRPISDKHDVLGQVKVVQGGVDFAGAGLTNYERPE